MELIIRDGEKLDCEAVHHLIKELAIYEKAESEFELSLEQFIEDGFGEHPIYFMFVALIGKELIGAAICYEKYSTWKGKSLFLEDLIVTEKHRGIGAGKGLFERVIKEAIIRKAGRMEWQVLDWNTPAINFYKKYEAELDGEWINGKFQKAQLIKFAENESF